MLICVKYKALNRLENSFCQLFKTAYYILPKLVKTFLLHFIKNLCSPHSLNYTKTSYPHVLVVVYKLNTLFNSKVMVIYTSFGNQ